MHQLELKALPDDPAELQKLFQTSLGEDQAWRVVLPLASVESRRSTGMVGVQNGAVSTDDLARAIDAALSLPEQEGFERVLYRIARIQVDEQTVSGLPIGQPARLLEVTVNFFQCTTRLLEQLRKAAAMANSCIACFDVAQTAGEEEKEESEDSLRMSIPLEGMTTLKVYRHKVVMCGDD